MNLIRGLKQNAFSAFKELEKLLKWSQGKLEIFILVLCLLLSSESWAVAVVVAVVIFIVLVVYIVVMVKRSITTPNNVILD